MLNHEALGNDLDRMALITQPFINICAAAQILHDFPTDEMVKAATKSIGNIDPKGVRLALEAIRDLIFE